MASVSVSAFSQDSDCETRDKLVATTLKGKYRYVNCFNDDLASVSNDSDKSVNGIFGFIDKTGKLVIPMEFTYAREFQEGLALVSKGDTDYFIDKTGKIVLDLSDYDFAWGFENGLARVSKDDENGIPFTSKQGYIDKTGKVVISLEYLEIDKFENGKTLALKYSRETGSKMGMINLNNEPIIPFDYSLLYGFKDGLSIAVKNCDMIMAQFGDRKEYKKCRFGVIDEHNRTIIPFEYQFIEGFENGVSVAIKNDKIGKIDTQGKVVEKFVPKPKTKPKERRNYI